MTYPDMSILKDDGSSQKERMLSGRLYYALMDPELLEDRRRAQRICKQFNATSGDDQEGRTKILKELFKAIDEEHPPWIETPFTCDYGYNITLGANVYMNFGCIILDGNDVIIGADTLIGPNVQFYPPGHPIDGQVRRGTQGPEFAHPIKIGDNCWIGGSAIFIGGVTVGSNVVVGAGAVVTKDVPDWCVVAGNPARVVKHLKPGDKSKWEIP